MKHTFENMRKISQNEYKYYTVDHIEKITTEDEMAGKLITEKQEHLCGTLGLYGTQNQINLAVDVLEELKDLVEQNKRYREALEFYADEINNSLGANFPKVVSKVGADKGETARKALGRLRNE